MLSLWWKIENEKNELTNYIKPWFKKKYLGLYDIVCHKTFTDHNPYAVRKYSVYQMSFKYTTIITCCNQ